MIANHATLLEEENAPRDEQLCVQAFEHVAEFLFKFDEAWAHHWVRRDCKAMTALKRLAQAPEPGLSAEELLANREELLRVLKAPPPELLALMPNAVNDLGFDALCCAIGVLDDPHERADALRTIAEWRGTSAVVGALGRAARQGHRRGQSVDDAAERDPARAAASAGNLRTWRPRACSCSSTRRRCCRPLSWARGTGRWQLRKPEVLRHKRVGLRDANLRVALLCAVLVHLLGSERRASSCRDAWRPTCCATSATRLRRRRSTPSASCKTCSSR